MEQKGKEHLAAEIAFTTERPTLIRDNRLDSRS
jgi:hypothetical protein